MKIELTSELTSLYKIDKIIEQISDEYQLNDTYFGCLTMAIQEGVKNAIIHGNQLNKEKIVTVEFDFNFSSIFCTISDQGQGFNVEDEFKKLSTNPTGNGLEIIKLTSDQCAYTNNGSTIELTFEMLNNDHHKINEKRRSMFLDAKLQKTKQGVKRNVE